VTAPATLLWSALWRRFHTFGALPYHTCHRFLDRIGTKGWRFPTRYTRARDEVTEGARR
jgi:hypothetical protein